MRFAGSHRMAVSESRGTVLLSAAGAFVVALAARRSRFCCHRLFAMLLRFGRRRTGLAEKTALGRAFCWTRACACWGTRPVAFVLASRRAGPGRPLGAVG